MPATATAIEAYRLEVRIALRVAFLRGFGIEPNATLLRAMALPEAER